MKQVIQFTLNRDPVRLETEPDRSLLWVLRGDMALTGTKYGCGEGHCGTCTVLVDGQAIRACVTTVQAVAGKAVTTIEGMAKDGQLHPLQQAFMDRDALQCGFCTPGMIMAAAGVLSGNPKASEADIIAGLDNNLCRCGAHKRIVEAVRTVSGGEQS